MPSSCTKTTSFISNMDKDHIRAALTWVFIFTSLLLVAALIGLTGALINLALYLTGIDYSL